MKYFVWLLLLTGLLQTAAAQDAEKKIYVAVLCNPAPPVLDGRMDDTVWQSAATGSGFVQNEPHNGEPSTEPTLFKVAYDARNLYVFIRAMDHQVNKMPFRLGRRDAENDCDEVGVVIDSYFDRRTAFAFGVTVAGVKKDLIFSNDGENEDASWDPVWDVKTAVDDSGWTAEMRIPFSQLRYSEQSHHIWGFEVYRELLRNNELSLWQPIPKDASGVVHCFGELHGLAGLDQPSRIELLPYSVSDLSTGRREQGNPFAPGRVGHFKSGLDGKIGLSSNLTMDFTINPDFGQVEADPSEVNLTAFETFFEEKRPFFIEGKNIFDYRLAMGDGDLAMDRLFYSRRIGRTPQYEAEAGDDEYLRAPQNTSILGAFKVSGKTRSGLSIGLVDAVTQQESAEFRSGAATRFEAIEPLSNYFAGRLQKDYSAGRTSAGMMFTGTHRKIEDDHLNFLNRAAYTGGIDLRHSWNNQNWLLDLRTSYSHIRGHKEALLEAQTSSARYFQRPDARHVELDSSRTTLSGSGGSLNFGKVGGGHWRFLVMGMWRTPGLELNDLGYMRQADEIIQIFWAGYRMLKPWQILRNMNVNLNQWRFWDFAGNPAGYGGNINGNATFTNNWNLNLGVNRESQWLQVAALRGGPAMLSPGGSNLFGNLSTDSRRTVSLSGGMSHYGNANQSTTFNNYFLNLQVRLSPAFSFSISPQLSNGSDELQYVDTIETFGGSRYLMARIAQKNLAMVMRFNYSLTPALSIQYYGQPFVAAGEYTRFKQITRPRAEKYDERFHLFTKDELRYDAENSQYAVDENGDGAEEYRFDKPDYNFRQFRSNLVVRWEYRPGSTLFLVWSQGRTGDSDDGAFVYRHDLRELFNVYPENVFLIKCNYWFSF